MNFSIWGAERQDKYAMRYHIAEIPGIYYLLSRIGFGTVSSSWAINNVLGSIVTFSKSVENIQWAVRKNLKIAKSH